MWTLDVAKSDLGGLVIPLAVWSHRKQTWLCGAHFYCLGYQFLWARSIQPRFQPVRPGKEDHLKRWTRFSETFPVGPNRSIEFWTEISGKFGWMDRALYVKKTDPNIMEQRITRSTLPKGFLETPDQLSFTPVVLTLRGSIMRLCSWL